MKIFISSVRRGLEEERDALPGLISAVGHTPVRFEDFSAQPLPSREACLAGVAASDAYVLLLGPNYGHRFSDTGQSPTHDEWVAATAAGLPRVVYRKLGVASEPEQEGFARAIGDYASGVFYDSFSTTAELLTKVAARVRELADGTSPLTFAPLPAPIAVSWRSEFDDQARRGASSPAAVEVHVVPIGAPARSARVMADLAQVIPSRTRESGVVSSTEALNTARPNGAIVVSVAPRRQSWNEPRQPHLLGVRLASGGQVSAWASLPGDSMGAILDAETLPEQIAGLLRLIGQLRVVESNQVAIGIGVNTALMLSTGRVAQLPRQSATMLSVSDRPIHVSPDELVTVAALDVGSPEVGRSLARALLEAVSTDR